MKMVTVFMFICVNYIISVFVFFLLCFEIGIGRNALNSGIDVTKQWSEWKAYTIFKDDNTVFYLWTHCCMQCEWVKKNEKKRVYIIICINIDDHANFIRFYSTEENWKDKNSTYFRWRKKRKCSSQKICGILLFFLSNEKKDFHIQAFFVRSESSDRKKAQYEVKLEYEWVN